MQAHSRGAAAAQTPGSSTAHRCPIPVRSLPCAVLVATGVLACSGSSSDVVATGDSNTGSVGDTASEATSGTVDGTGDATAGPTTGNDSVGGSDGVTSSDEGGEIAVCPLPASVNAILDEESGLVPLVRVGDPQVEAFTVTASGSLVARSLAGEVLWSRKDSTGDLLGGFDYDGDDWPDLGLAHHEPGPTPCGASTIGTSWIELIDGRDGSTVYETAAESDICWTFPSATYPTTQWGGGVLFGEGPTLFLSATYATTSSMPMWDGEAFVGVDVLYPSTPGYDATYAADQLNAWGLGTSYLANSHVANGLVGTFAGETRAVVFTSGRVVQYAAAARPSDRLREDRPFLSAGRTDLAGRNYGLVARDPAAPQRVVLLAGTSIATWYTDMIAAAMTSDPWGGIERHVAVYDTSTNTIVDRFYSYAHDANDGHQFEGRVAYPANPFVSVAGSPSRIAYSVYEGGHWILHVSQPGDPADAMTLRGVALVDIRDLDGDGTDEWIASRTELEGDPDVPGYYFGKWRLDVYHWDETDLELSVIDVDQAGTPVPLAAFRTTDRSSSAGLLFPAAIVERNCAPAIVLRTSAGELVTHPVSGARAPNNCTCD